MNKPLHFKAFMVMVVSLGHRLPMLFGRPFRKGFHLSLLAALCLPQVVFCGGVVSNADETDLLAAMAGGGTVTFAVNGTIYLTNTIVVSNNTVLDATGQTVAISGSNAVQIFIVNSNTTLAITNVTMSDGYFEGPIYYSSGGGGAISNAGMLQLTDCTFTNNSAVVGPDSEFLSDGGAIYNTGTLQLRACAFTNNSAASQYVSDAGGAIYNTGTLQMTNCVFCINTAAGIVDYGIESAEGDGGAVYNDGALQMTGCVFSCNSAVGTPFFDGGGSEGKGGAVYNDGTLQMTGCAFGNNRAVGASSYGMGAEGDGGAVYSTGIVTVMGSDFIGNSAVGGTAGDFDGGGWVGGSANGGAMYISDQATFINCVFSNNTASGGAGGNSTAPEYVGVGAPANGGGICSYGVLSVYATTFAGNQAVGGAGGNAASYLDVGSAGPGGNGTGGGLCVETGVLLMVNSTFCGNAASGSAGGYGLTDPFDDQGGNGGNGGNGVGGGIGVLAGTAALTNVTLANNISTGAPGGAGGSGTPNGTNGMSGLSQGQAIAASGGTITLLNSILDCSSGDTNGFGGIIDAGYNLNSDATDYLTNSTSLNGVNPDLGPLGNYGGPTPTIPLLAGSPAINAADPSSFPATDQRGFPRPYGPEPCIGAFEYYPTTLFAGTACYTRHANISLKIAISDLLTKVTNANVGSITLVGVGTDGLNLLSTNGTTLFTNSTYILYTNSVTPNVNDSFNYTVSDEWGGTGIGTVLITMNNNVVGQANVNLNVSSTNVTANFFGVPGYQYTVDRSTNLTQGLGWVPISTNTAPGNGLIQVVDNFQDLGIPIPPVPSSAYYRLRYNPSN